MKLVVLLCYLALTNVYDVLYEPYPVLWLRIPLGVVVPGRAPGAPTAVNRNLNPSALVRTCEALPDNVTDECWLVAETIGDL